jgi:uncharacterized protein (DUF2237 family)
MAFGAAGLIMLVLSGRSRHRFMSRTLPQMNVLIWAPGEDACHCAGCDRSALSASCSCAVRSRCKHVEMI